MTVVSDAEKSGISKREITMFFNKDAVSAFFQDQRVGRNIEMNMYSR